MRNSILDMPGESLSFVFSTAIIAVLLFFFVSVLTDAFGPNSQRNTEIPVTETTIVTVEPEPQPE